MSRNLLIVGASTYSVVAYEIATDMACFDKIDFIDDNRKTTPNGISVVGTAQDVFALASEYSDIIVAIGNPDVRSSLLKKFKEETPYKIATLISPKAYVSPTAQIAGGCVIEPMAVVHSGCTVSEGCFISAGAVVNHASACGECVHVDCNATVEGYCTVPKKTKISAGEVYKKKDL